MPSNGSTSARGYDERHKQTRRDLEPVVATGTVRCPRCRRLIAPDDVWDLGHTDDRTGYTGPEHASCNRIAGGRQPKPNPARRTPEAHPGLLPPRTT